MSKEVFKVESLLGCTAVLAGASVAPSKEAQNSDECKHWHLVCEVGEYFAFCKHQVCCRQQPEVMIADH